MSVPALTASADPGARIPGHDGARRDRIEAAIASLRGELRRAERLGLEAPLRRCRASLRYWEFLGALFALPEAPVHPRVDAQEPW